MPNVLRIISQNLDPMVLAPDGSWVKFVIERYDEEEIDYGRGAEEKGILWMVGHKKKIVLNVTNTRALIKLFGSPNSDDWIGKECYARGEHVRTPSGGSAFSWRFDDGTYAMEVFRRQSTEAAMSGQQTSAPASTESAPEQPGEWASMAEAEMQQEVDFQ